jgi:hypothetical protein
MKNGFKPLMAVAMLATVAFAAGNVENPVYAPAQLGFYSKTGVGWMYKKSDDNDAMKAKDWAKETENPIPRITEDFGFGLTDWLVFRGAFGYTYDGDIERSGMHQARLGLGLRPVNSPVDAVVWDIYADAFLGGVSKMKATIVKSKNDLGGSYPFSFNYENYGNGRWGVWVGTQVGKTFDKLNVAVFGEVERTFGNNNNQITIDKSAKDVIQGKVRGAVPSVEGSQVYTNVYSQVHPTVLSNLPQVIGLGCQQNGIPQAACSRDGLIGLLGEAAGEATFGAIEAGATTYLEGLAKTTTQRMADSIADKIAEDFVEGLPKDFNVDTKSTWEFAAGLKSLYEISSDLSIGGAFNWKHRATNSIKAVNIKNTSTNPDAQTVAIITKGIGNSFEGSMKDGVDEFALSLLGSKALTESLQLTLYGEYTFDTAEEKAQLGTTMKAELGLRMNWQF